jgi:anoctamin-8
MLKGAEDLAIKKQLTEELGGGLKEFLAADVDCFKGSNDPDTFFTTEERQRIVRHFLYNLRAKNEDHVGKLNFLEGQAIGK